MKIYTAHTRPHAAPVLVPEGFALGGYVFGPFWLLAHGAWVAAAIALSADIALALAAPPSLRLVLALAISWLIGLFGHDMWRWSLQGRGYVEVHVIAATDADTALGRLLDRRPDLIGDAIGRVAAA